MRELFFPLSPGVEEIRELTGQHEWIGIPVPFESVTQNLGVLKKS